MKKISTLYLKDNNDLGRVINKVNPDNKWVLEGLGIPTRKFDGTACAVIDGNLYKRYDCRIDKMTGKYKKSIPIGAIPCDNADPQSGHHPHWVKCDINNPADKYHFEAFEKQFPLPDGTYELIGKKVQGNPERVDGHVMVRHGAEVLDISDFTFIGLRDFLRERDIEGIVFHHKKDGRMCKIRKSDFGIRR